MKQFIYEQLANELRERITNKEWNVNERLPSIRSLCELFNVSKVSVQNALHKLEASGLIKARPRSGYYVVEKFELKSIELLNNNQAIEKPKLVEVPDIFHEIMNRSAAFDIYPKAKLKPVTSHIKLLNRHITRAMRSNISRNTLYYGNPNGVYELKEQISKHYKSRQLSINPDDICITSGCQNSLFLALSTCCKPGDTVAIESPAFYGVLQLIQSLDLQVIEIPSSVTQGLKTNDLVKVLEEWKIDACIVTPNFSTPTGSCITLEEKKKLYQLSVQHEFTIIEDDIYGDLGFHFSPEPIKSFDKTGNVILCSSMSKSLSRDLRIGWIVGGNYHDKIMRSKLINQLSGNQGIQQGLATFMAEGYYRRHLLQYRQTLRVQRDELVKLINNHWSFPYSYTLPEGGLSLWVELANTVNTVALYNKALEKNIVLTPGSLFSSTGKFNHCLRLSFVHPMEGERLKAVKELNAIINYSEPI